MSGDDRLVYTLDQVLVTLAISRRTFYRLDRAGDLPMVREVFPRLGRRRRFDKAHLDAWMTTDQQRRWRRARLEVAS